MTRGEDFKGKTCLVSGSGNVAQYTVEKLNQLGAKCHHPCPTPKAPFYDRDGIDAEKLAFVMDLKNNRRGRIKEYAKKFTKAEFFAGKKPWHFPAECAFPAPRRTKSTARRPGTRQERRLRGGRRRQHADDPRRRGSFPERRRSSTAPGKAANAGGVATSGLEMAQNSSRLSWTREEVDAKLKGIMTSIHNAAHETAKEYGCPADYVLARTSPAS